MRLPASKSGGKYVSRTEDGHKRHCGSGNVESLNAEKKTLMKHTFTLSIYNVPASMLNRKDQHNIYCPKKKLCQVKEPGTVESLSQETVHTRFRHHEFVVTASRAVGVWGRGCGQREHKGWQRVLVPLYVWRSGGAHYPDYEDDFMDAHVSKCIRVHFKLGKDNSQSSLKKKSLQSREMYNANFNNIRVR